MPRAPGIVNHDIVLKELSVFGIKGETLDWFKSYFSNRKQFFENGKTKTGFQDIKCDTYKHVFLEIPVLRFALFPYYRQMISLEQLI